MDLQEEILSRVPAKSLARWKSTPKQWKGILKLVALLMHQRSLYYHVD